MNPALQATALQTFQLLVSFLSAYGVHRVLGGTAMVRRNGVRLGGAAASFFLVFYMLNHFLPDVRTQIVSDAMAAQRITVSTEAGVNQQELARVSLRPATQLITRQDLGRLDRNRFHIEDQLQIAVLRPPSDAWEVSTSSEYLTVNTLDIPMLSMSMGGLRSALLKKTPRIMTVRNKKRHEVVLDASSTIDSIAMTLNLFDNPEFANRILTSQFEAMSKMGLAEAPPREMLEVLIKTMSETVAPQIKKSIEKQLPIKRELYDAIYAVPLGKETLELPDGLNKLAPRATILDQAIRYSSLQGYVNLQSVQNLYVNQERRMASFDGSVRLENVKIDGKLTNAVVNTVGFIVAGDERAVLVVVVFLSTEPVATFKILEEMLSSLVFTA